MSDLVLDRLTPAQRERILEYVIKRVATSEDGNHLIWTGSTGGVYHNPIIKFGNRTVMIRRWMLAYVSTPVSSSDTVTNTCGIEGCVLPDHLNGPVVYQPKNEISVRWYQR